MNHSATLSINAGDSHRTARGSKRVFARHFGEMILAMFVGMAVLGGLAELAFAASGSSLTDQAGGLQVALMGLSMTLPMVAWMRRRRWCCPRSSPPSSWAGTLDSAAALSVQHAAMIPAMLGVMIWRYEDYSRSH